MLLKRLELQGYKTFASRTDFEFEPGVTAVVGPNGSGKSNIADAIRWVLGEQSYSLLRGRKTEDMIFSGTQRRSRAGMAQATIVLDNANGQFPLEFSEIAISRRAYRSGENEYRINNSRVRLRDVNEVLSASGLAQRTYNVIGQGLVDAALSLRAGERRALFEEAAGIALYKERREDTLRKLETTRRNLERVEDILSEIRPRMRRLARQAARSREHSQVQADLDNLLYLWYGYHWEQAKSQLRGARQEAAEQEAVLEAMLEEQTGLVDQIGQLRASSHQLRTRLSELHAQNSQLHREAERLQRSLAVRSERQRLLGEQLEQQQTERGPLEAQLELADTQHQAAAKALAGTDKLWQDQQEAVRRVRSQLEQRQQQVAELRRQEEETGKTVIRLESKTLALGNRREELNRDLTRLGVERETLQEALSQQSKDHERAQSGLAAQQGGLDELDSQIAELDGQRERLRQERLRGQEALSRVQEETRAAQTRLAELEAEQRALDQVRRSGTGHQLAVQRLLTSPERPAGLVGPVVQLFSVPVEWERPLADLLGDSQSALVVEDWPAAEQVFEQVEQDGEAGRLELLPLADLRPRAPINPAQVPMDQKLRQAVVGVASDLVTVPPAYEAVRDLLLGHVLLVENGAAARALAPLLPAGCCAFTPEGTLLWQDGRVVRRAQGSGGALFTQERLWRALPDQLATTQEMVAAAEGSLDEAQQRLNLCVRDLEGVEAELGEARERRSGLDRQRETAALQLDRVEQNIAWHHERLRELGQRSSVAERELDAVMEQEAATADQRRQALAARQEYQTQIAEASPDDLRAELSVRERELAGTEGARRNQHALTETHRKSVQEMRDRSARLDQRMAAISEERRELAEQMRGERRAERKLTEKIDGISRQIRPADEQLAQVESRLETMQSQEEEIRGRLRRADQMHNQAQLKLGRRRDHLEHLRTRIQDELGLVHLPLDDDIEGQAPLPLGDMVGQLPSVRELPDGLEDSIQRRKQQLRRMGPINPGAPAEHAELQQRNSFLTEQVDDLRQADTKLRQVIAELDAVMEEEFLRTFEAVAAEFRKTFTRLFDGGSARLVLTDPEDPIQSGVEIIARPPGRRQQGLALLSGGERSLTAAALIFALLRVSPTPFCVLDEMDAMLDETNVGRFREMLTELAESTQFIVITHNRGTVQSADTIYGVTMNADGSSQVISLRLEGERLSGEDGQTVSILKA